MKDELIRDTILATLANGYAAGAGNLALREECALRLRCRRLQVRRVARVAAAMAAAGVISVRRDPRGAVKYSAAPC